MMALRAFETRDALMHATALRVAEALQTGISERGEACAALSGGATPEPAYTVLAAMPLDWPRVTFLLVDERFVPLSDDFSNEAFLRRALAPALTAGARVLPMYSNGVSSEEAAARADALYARRSIDIALLGMGGDGHTASWFPQSPQIESALAPDNPRAVISVVAEGAAGTSKRLTLTRAAVARARAITLLMTGDQKRALLEDRSRARLPVDALFDLGGPVETFWAP